MLLQKYNVSWINAPITMKLGSIDKGDNGLAPGTTGAENNRESSIVMENTPVQHHRLDTHWKARYHIFLCLSNVMWTSPNSRNTVLRSPHSLPRPHHTWPGIIPRPIHGSEADVQRPTR